jgi:hypothetical protein
VIEALLGGIGLQLCCTAEPLWADVDREIAALRQANLEERIDKVPVWLEWWHERLAGLPYAMDGPLAALVQGAPVPARWLDLAVPRSALDGLAAVLTGTTNLQRWSENWNDWGYRASPVHCVGAVRSANCGFGCSMSRCVRSSSRCGTSSGRFGHCPMWRVTIRG